MESELRAPAQAELVHFLCGRAGDDKGPKDGRSRLAGLEKRGLVGSFSPKRISEGRRYLKICTLSLGIRKWAPTLTRRIKVISRDLSDGGGRGGVVPGQSGGTCALVSPECQRGAFSLVTLEPGASWGAWGGYEVWEALWNSSLWGRGNGVCERCGLYFFLKQARRHVWAPAESRVQGEKWCREENQERQVPTRPPWMSQVAPFWSGEGTRCVHTPTHVHRAPAPLSAEKSRRDHFTTSLLSTSVCSLSGDVHWTLKGVGSALSARQTVRWRCQLCGQEEPQRAGPQVPHTLTWLEHFPWAGLAFSAVPHLHGTSSVLSPL